MRGEASPSLDDRERRRTEDAIRDLSFRFQIGLVIEEITVLLDNPFAELYPEPTPFLLDFLSFLRLEARVFYAPHSELLPAVECHVVLSSKDLVEVMREL